MGTDTDTEAIAENLLSDAEHEAQDSAVKQKYYLWYHDWVVGSNATRWFVFLGVVESARKLYPGIYKTVTADELNTLLSDERIQNIIDEDTKKRQFRNIRNLAVLRHSQLASGEGRLATLRSWDEAYIGDAHNVLYETITSQIQSDYRSSVRYQAIIQSSCIGKSRMVDQLSKKHLVIPINLRRDGPGFPPGDAQVVDFLLRLPFNQIDAYKRSQAFLISLFKAAHVVLGGIAMTMKDVSPETSRELFSQEFRNYTRAGQTFEKHGSNRVLFYNRVISQAKSLLNSEDHWGNGEPIHKITFTEEGMTSTHLSPVLIDLLRLLNN